MAQIFGDRWTSQWGEVPTGPAAETWLVITRPMSQRQVRIGLRCCMHSESPFPPSPGQFRKWVEENDSQAHRTPDHLRLPPAQRIGKPVARPEVFEKHMSELRAMFGAPADESGDEEVVE